MRNFFCAINTLYTVFIMGGTVALRSVNYFFSGELHDRREFPTGFSDLILFEDLPWELATYPSFLMIWIMTILKLTILRGHFNNFHFSSNSRKWIEQTVLMSSSTWLNWVAWEFPTCFSDLIWGLALGASNLSIFF